MNDSKLFAVEMSFRQTVTGEAYGNSEEEIRTKLEKEFEEAPEFIIHKIEYLGEASQMSMDFTQSLN